MPEGDTILRTARILETALAGREVIAFESPVPAVASAARRQAIVGDTVARVEALGKHLLIRFAGGATLHTHLGMAGRWRVGPAGRRLRPPGRVRVRLETENAVAVCSRSPVVELLSAWERACHPGLRRLGPDVLSSGFDPAAARNRLRGRPDLEIGVALLDQTALAGIGNVYKSEVLFLCGVSPFARVRELEDRTLDRLIDAARDLMTRNLGPGRRRTTPRSASTSVWVYRRSRRPCRRCGATILRAAQGEQARSTYYCPDCQAPQSSG